MHPIVEQTIVYNAVEYKLVSSSDNTPVASSQ